MAAITDSDLRYRSSHPRQISHNRMKSNTITHHWVHIFRCFSSPAHHWVPNFHQHRNKQSLRLLFGRMLDPLHSVVGLVSYAVTSDSYRTPQLKLTRSLRYPPSKRLVLSTKKTKPDEYFQPSASRTPKENVPSVPDSEKLKSNWCTRRGGGR